MGPGPNGRNVAASWPRSVLRLEALPASLRPLVRAYLIGYGWTVGSQVLVLLAKQAARRRRQGSANKAIDEEEEWAELEPRHAVGVAAILRRGLDITRFPTFFALLVGGSAILEIPARKLCQVTLRGIDPRHRTSAARWLAGFVSAWFSLRLFQSRPRRTGSGSSSEAPEEGHIAGRTLDLTLLAATRAADVIVGELWSRYRARREARGTWSRADHVVSKVTDTCIFAASCAVIMWSFIYSPDRLPPSYRKWIASAAAADERLLEALRRFRRGEIRYGEDTGQAGLLAPMCADYGLPAEWGDPARSVPYPCELVHMGCGRSCEAHAAIRFCRTFCWSMATYLPLNVVALLLRHRARRGRRISAAALGRVLRSAGRSSAFLSTLVALFWYGVCLARSRVGPAALGRTAAAAQRIDSGICAGAACALCGWSVLIESAGRRKDMALFAAPRAVATLLPRRYAALKQWREGLVFATSAAVVLTCARENRGRVRGLLGAVLGGVLAD